MNHFFRAMALIFGLLLVGTSAWSAEKIVLVAGGDGATGDAKLASPFGVEFDGKGNLLIVEFTSRLRALTPDGKLITICGDGVKGDSGDGGPAKSAKLNAPHSIAVDSGGNILVADTLNHKVRKIDAKTGIITTIAGTTRGFSGDNGPADKAQFNGIYCISLNPQKTMLVLTDLENKRIRVMDLKTGIVTTAAGNGEKGVPKDGSPAAISPLADPRAAAMDSKGNIYILERGGRALRVVDPAGKIHTLIPGPKAAKDPSEIRGPKHLWIDPNDDVLITDTDHHRIVKWLAADKRMVVIAGAGKTGKEGIGGPPDLLQMNQPHGVYLAPDGTLYICDSMNNRVLKVVKE